VGRAAGSDGGNVPALQRAVRRGGEIRRLCAQLLAFTDCDQWLAPETNRKASSIVLTPAFDPSEPVSIFEY
jgi:hypothetical protein